MTTKIERRIKIKYRVRNKISGTTECPRMSVFRSNKQIYVQIIATFVNHSSVQSSVKQSKDTQTRNHVRGKVDENVAVEAQMK